MSINTAVSPNPNGSTSNRSTATRRITRQPAPAASSTNGANGSTESAPPANASMGEQIMDRAVILVLEISRAGNRRSVSSDAIEIDAEREDIRISKRLLEAPQLRAILKHDRSIRRFIKARCLPSYFKAGMSLLPLALVEAVDTRLAELAAHREVLVAQFIEDYPELVHHAQTRLRGLFDPSDYPDPEVVRGAFEFSWRYITLSVPTTLAAIDRSIFSREREKAAEQWDEAARSIQTLLRANMAELIGHMTERLTPGADGQAKSFGNSMVGNLTEFLRNFDARNITDDAALAALVARARELLEGVDPQTLRRSDNLRETVREGFSGLQRSLDQMVGNRPARRIVLNRPAAVEAASIEAPPVEVAPVEASPIEAVAVEATAAETEASEPAAVESEVPDSANVSASEVAPVPDETPEPPSPAMIAASVRTRRRADERVPLVVRTSPEFGGFRAMVQHAGLPWTSHAHASAFESAMQAAAGILTPVEEMTTEDYDCAARLVADGRLRW